MDCKLDFIEEKVQSDFWFYMVIDVSLDISYVNTTADSFQKHFKGKTIEFSISLTSPLNRN